MGILGRLFARNGWNRFPQPFVAGLERRLGKDDFRTLTTLAEKYGFFEQRLFANPKALDIDDELTRTQVAALVTSMGNALMRDQAVEDAEKAFNIALCLLPEHFPARGSLAMICYHTGRTDEARQHAAHAVADMDKHKERFKNVPIPEHIASQDELDDYRNLLAKIADGEPIEKAAEQGDAVAQYNLGVMYRSGDGVPQDYKEAVKWYTKAAEQGNASAQFNLGWMYREGRGVPQDCVEAAKWFTNAAEQGDTKAQYNLGVMYAQGQGVPQDYKEGRGRGVGPRGGGEGSVLGLQYRRRVAWLRTAFCGGILLDGAWRLPYDIHIHTCTCISERTRSWRPRRSASIWRPTVG
jgi:TPR repeat protein